MKKVLNKPFLVGTLVLSLAALFAAGQPMRMDGDLEQLQGYWEGDGPGGTCSITISGNSLRYYGREDFWYETTFTLPAGTDPQQLHATIVRDSSAPDGSGRDVGTVVVAIVKVEDETLTLAVNQDTAGPVPSSFSGDSSLPVARYDLKRGTPGDESGTEM